MPDTRQVLNWLGLLLLIAIVIPFVIYAVPGVAGAEGSYVVLSGSMEPTISTGDVVLVDDVEPGDIEERDVITYLRSGADTPTTHRVVGINEDGGELSFVTQGDANDQPDASPVAASEVRGQVVFTIPYIGYVVEFVNTPMGFFALVILPFALLLLSEMYSMLSGSDSGPDDEGPGETPAGAGDPDQVRAVSPAPVKSLASEGAVPMDPDDEGIAPAVRRPVSTSNTVDMNGKEVSPDPAGDDDTSGEDAIAFTRSDLRLSLGLLAGTAIYAAWVVYNVQAAWSFAVAFGSGIGLLLVGTMYYAAGSDDAAARAATSDAEPRTPSASDGATDANSQIRADGAPTGSPEGVPEIEGPDRSSTEGTDE